MRITSKIQEQGQIMQVIAYENNPTSSLKQIHINKINEMIPKEPISIGIISLMFVAYFLLFHDTRELK